MFALRAYHSVYVFFSSSSGMFFPCLCAVFFDHSHVKCTFFDRLEARVLRYLRILRMLIKLYRKTGEFSPLPRRKCHYCQIRDVLAVSNLLRPCHGWRITDRL